MTQKQIESFLKKNWHKSNPAISKELQKKGVQMSASSVSRWGAKMNLPPKQAGGQKRTFNQVSEKDQIAIDKGRLLLLDTKRQQDKKYKTVLLENQRLQKELEIALAIQGKVKPVSYSYKPFSRETESVAVVLASDWHIEEKVDPATVDGFNEYTLTIAKQRAEQFFKTVVRLTEIENTFTRIDTLVLALLGDFISSNIHEALLEINETEPIHALIEAENLLIGGIQYILDHTKLNLIIPCHVGNHSRITKKVHIATETGNSLETIMYHHIQNHFRDNKRVKMLISPAYLSYLTIWDYTICFQHGHAVNFAGGVGGLTIPLKKAVAQWQKKRKVNLYCLGHWHQFLDIGEAVVNGSMIGYSSYVQFIKGDPERPKQAFFVINRKFNEKIAVRPILFQ